MSNEITRENVQQIVDRNAAEHKSKAAAMEAQERKLRKIINQNHTDKTTVQTAATAPQIVQKKPKEAERECTKAMDERAERRAQEAEYCNAWYQFIFLVFAPLILVSMLVTLAGGAPITIPLLICMAAYVALILLTSIKAFFPKSILTSIKTTLADNVWPRVKEYMLSLN